MRIDRDALQALHAAGRAAARAWANGCAQEALGEISRTAYAPEFRSRGTDAISPQAATHLGHAITEALGQEAESGETALALAAALLASPNASLRMVGPHVLTPLVRERPTCAGRVIELADLCADPAATAALAIPLAAAVTRDPCAAAASLGQSGDSARRRLALRATRQALATRNPKLARMLPDAIAKAAGRAPPAD